MVMRLPFIMNAFGLLGKRRRGHSVDTDTEKAQEEPANEPNGPSGPEEDDEDPLAPNSHHRLRRLSSATEDTFFSNAVTNRTLNDGPTTWTAKLKSYVFPSDDNISDIEDFIPNYRWLPIFSGILIPFSILLDIPGLTERWYIKTQNNMTIDTKPNSDILDIGMALSLSCAVIANICLVCRFLEKGVKTSTIFCALFLTTHDIINITTVTIFGVQHRSNDGFTYGDSFWMTVCSTITSTATNISLIVDYVKTPDFARSGSGLTRKQRALVVIVIVLMVYISLGAMCNTFIMGLTYINALYFTTVSIETIGFGDIQPNTTGARVFICFYSALGIVNLGVAVAMTRETVLEGLEVNYRKRLKRMRRRKRQAQRLRRWESRWKRAVMWRLREMNEAVWVPTGSQRQNTEPSIRFREPTESASYTEENARYKQFLGAIGWNSDNSHQRGHPRGKRLNIDALDDRQLEAAALEAGVPLDMFFDRTSRQPTNISQQQSHLREGVGEMVARHTSNWPDDSETPTHAQVGRMAALVTKFAVAVMGRHAHPEGGSSPKHSEQQDSPQGQGQGQDVSQENVAGWVQEFARECNERPSTTYDSMKDAMRAEEKRVYYVKLLIAWSILLVFWTIGAAIFHVTEDWSYGIAIYFCFTAFTTIGYGDFSPKTPAGRSIFVVWALFGVATMTILVSVLQDAESSKYKSALHSTVFDKAVKNYRRRNSVVKSPRFQLQEARLQGDIPSSSAAANNDNEKDVGVGSMYVDERLLRARDDPRIEEAQQAAQNALESLPLTVIQQGRAFRDYLKHFVEQSVPGEDEADDGNAPAMPSETKEIMDEIAQEEGIGERMKAEILQDDDARNTLFLLSIEKSLRKMVQSAEEALAALARRDALLASQNQRIFDSPRSGFVNEGADGSPDLREEATDSKDSPAACPVESGASSAVYSGSFTNLHRKPTPTNIAID